MTPNGGMALANQVIANQVAIGRIEERLDRVEEGVSNFRDFQQEARDFFTRADERAIHRVQQEEEEKEERDRLDQRRSRLHFTLLGGLISLIVGLTLWLVQWTTNFEKRHKVSEDTTEFHMNK